MYPQRQQPTQRRYLLLPLGLDLEQEIEAMALHDHASWSKFVVGVPFEPGDVLFTALAAADQGRYTEKYQRCLPENRSSVLKQIAKRAIIDLYKPAMRAKIAAMNLAPRHVA